MSTPSVQSGHQTLTMIGAGAVALKFNFGLMLETNNGQLVGDYVVQQTGVLAPLHFTCDLVAHSTYYLYIEVTSAAAAKDAKWSLAIDMGGTSLMSISAADVQAGGFVPMKDIRFTTP